jgi:uncharacterized membrane protein YjgN (DUF898 family)
MPHGSFEFKGRGGGYLWLVIWTGFLTILTAGIFYPWAMSAMERWKAKNTFIDGKQLVFKGTGAGLIGNWIVIILLSLITVGIYAPWGYCRIQRWINNNRYFADPADVAHGD